MSTKYENFIDEEEYLQDVDMEEQSLKTPLVAATNPTTTKTQTQRRKNGCLQFRCCQCVLVTLAVVFTLYVLLLGCAYFWMKDAVQHLTVTTPHAKFPVVDMSPAELDVVGDRVALFFDQLRAGTKNMEDLVVTQEEINGFIGQSDYLRGNMFVTFEKGVIQEEYSLPAGMLPGGKGRYFVASDHLSFDEEKGEMELEMETAAKHKDWFDGPLFFAQLHYLVNQHNVDEGLPLLELYLQKGSLFGEEVPEHYIRKHDNLLAYLVGENDDDDAIDVFAILNGIERVSIEKGKIVVKARN